MRVLDAAEARAFDRWAIERLGVPPMVLMENAAIALADAVGDRFADARRVAIFAGPGNNGGDGLALARQLAARSYDVRIRLCAFGKALSNDCSRQLEICQALGLDLRELEPEWRPEAETLLDADLFVDALFGTGLARALAEPFAGLAEWIGSAGPSVLAVDLPSGLEAGSGRVPGPAVRADLSVTFGALRVAHVLAPAAARCGALSVADLGVPFDAWPDAPGGLELRSAAELAPYAGARPAQSHKGDFGHLLLVAGSEAMGGAAILAARAAIAGGAGRVTVATPEANRAALLAAVPEAMVHMLPAKATTTAALGDALARATVVAVGPGLGTSKDTVALVRALVRDVAVPLVVDADGLNALADDAGRKALRRRAAPTLLTPHPGEAGRLLGIDTAAVQDDRLAAVRRLAEATGATVVLKGHRTLVSDPDGATTVLVAGNPALATPGSGDVLTGLVAARLAQGDDPALSAELAVTLHGLAADLAVAEGEGPVVPAGALAALLPRAWAALAAADET